MGISLLSAFQHIFGSIPDPPVLSSVHTLWEPEWSMVAKPEVAICAFTLFTLGIISSAAGVGGGGVYVAALMVAGKLSPWDAVPLSKAVVFFGALGSLVINLQRESSLRHPSAIDFDTCRVVVPAALAGTFFGVVLNWQSTDTLIVGSQSIMLLGMSILVLRSAWLQYLEEQQALQGLGNLHPQIEDVQTQLSSSNPQDDDAAFASEQSVSQDSPQELERLRKLPRLGDAVLAAWLLLTVILGGVLRFHMHACRMEKETVSLQKTACNHPVAIALLGYRFQLWMGHRSTAAILHNLAISVPIWSCMVVSVHFGRYVIRGPGKWSVQKAVAFQLVSFITGCVAGLLGIGGGVIFSPFFLLSGMEPAMAVGTSATCVLFTSVSSATQYALTDRVIVSLSLVYGATIVVASVFGTKLVHILQDRYATRRSFTTLIVAAAVTLSAVLALRKFVTLILGGQATAL